MFPIPTFVINLKKRLERKKYILKEFHQKSEFDVTVVEAHEHEIGAVGLWNSIKHVLENEVESKYEYIIICEDDHQFSDDYSKELLFSCIDEAKARNADILSGGVSWFNNAVPISENIIWVEKFSGFQFTIIFKSFFKIILEANFENSDDADFKTSALTANKFFIFPFISVQKDFGYSDVTPKNNEKGRVEMLFNNSLNKAKMANYLCSYYLNNPKNINLTNNSDTYKNIIIPTYIINLSERNDRLKHIKEQFKGKSEFDITIVDACKHEVGAVGLWLSIRKIIEMAIANDDDLIIVCEDDHEFTEHYSKEFFLKNLMEAYYQRTEVLSGGIGGFDMAIPVTKNRFWLSAFYCTQFLVLYKSIFKKILDWDFNEKTTADGIFSEISSYKMTLFPFISIQKEFGYSDITKSNDRRAISSLFISAESRLKLTQYAYNKYCIASTTLEELETRSLNELLDEINRITEVKHSDIWLQKNQTYIIEPTII